MTGKPSAAVSNRILIVEDEPLIAMMLEDIVIELGYSVAGPVGSVTEALAFVAANPVDAALLDVNLGREKIDPVADQLAKLECPFIFTTGYGKAGVPAGHEGRPFVQKPFRMDEIAAALAALLAANTA